MQIRTSYLQQPRREVERRQDYPQREPGPGGSPEIGLSAETSAGIGSMQVIATKPESTRRSAKGKAAVKFLYRWVVRFVLVGSLVLLASLILFLWAPRARPSTAKELRPVPHMTARTAYDIARPAVLRWAEDSRLVGLSGTWDSASNYLNGEGDWSLLFYSPSQSSTALVSVVEGSAAVVNTHGVMQQPQLQTIELWRLDSPEVIKLLKRNGGDEFLRGQPQAGLALSLSLVGQSAWSARLINQESRRILQAQFNADDGELIEIHQSG